MDEMGLIDPSLQDLKMREPIHLMGRDEIVNEVFKPVDSLHDVIYSLE